MANAPTQAFTDHMQVLFGVGTCAGLTDGQLLERFLAGRDQAGELAFEALVERHGPMVLRVCRNGLDEPPDVHDAFQAVFLVLARRACSIRDRQSVGSWLYGVALRVNARARFAAIRRQIRDRRTIGAAQSMAADVANQHDASPWERNDQADVVHQELSRLPEKYRAPVVLCYLEGLTHDEAAARLRWPVGTVRSRLSRARDRLRTRLTRRGVTAPASIGPLARWITANTTFSTPSIAELCTDVIPRELASSIARTVSRAPFAQSTAATAGTSTSLLLAQGVLKMMLFKKLLIAACVLPTIAVLTLGGGLFLVRTTQAQAQKPAGPATVHDMPAAPPKSATEPDEIARLAQKLLEAARKRLEAQRAYYEEGRITIDRFVDASKQLELAELRLAKTDADRLAVWQRHVDRVKEIEKREKAELELGRGTISDLLEAQARRLEAELDLKLSQRREAGEMAAVLRRLNDLERKVEALQKERVGN
jgi:RNA polymerase sigma factor (sigma-70 family)